MASSRLLDLSESDHWQHINAITSQGPFNLMNTINNYMATLSNTQHDTYTDPFEVVTPNIGECFNLIFLFDVNFSNYKNILFKIGFNFL